MNLEQLLSYYNYNITNDNISGDNVNNNSKNDLIYYENTDIIIDNINHGEVIDNNIKTNSNNNSNSNNNDDNNNHNNKIKTSSSNIISKTNNIVDEAPSFLQSFEEKELFIAFKQQFYE